MTSRPTAEADLRRYIAPSCQDTRQVFGKEKALRSRQPGLDESEERLQRQFE